MKGLCLTHRHLLKIWIHRVRLVGRIQHMVGSLQLNLSPTWAPPIPNQSLNTKPPLPRAGAWAMLGVIVVQLNMYVELWVLPENFVRNNKLVKNNNFVTNMAQTDDTQMSKMFNLTNIPKMQIKTQWDSILYFASSWTCEKLKIYLMLARRSHETSTEV